MALEAGSTMHEVFSAVRIWQLRFVQELPNHAKATAKRLFGLERWKHCESQISAKRDSRDGLLELLFNVLHTSDWADDPNDPVRTLSNLQTAAIVYVDERLPHMENWPLYVESKAKPNGMIGIEQIFDVILNFPDGIQLRYIGTIDGLVRQAATDRMHLDENKTANRLSVAWQQSFDMSHQVTGYCAVSESVFGFPTLRSRVTGLEIKSNPDCFAFEPVPRTYETVDIWARWVRECAEKFEKYEKDYEHAPRYTHSCSRYFRTCALLPFCADTVSGRKVQWDNMVPAYASPSEEAAEARWGN